MNYFSLTGETRRIERLLVSVLCPHTCLRENEYYSRRGAADIAFVGKFGPRQPLVLSIITVAKKYSSTKFDIMTSSYLLATQGGAARPHRANHLFSSDDITAQRYSSACRAHVT